MPEYPLLKTIHVTAACLIVILFVLRLALDATGHGVWRKTPLRWLPHLNDTILLVAAIGLLVVTGWSPLIHHWLTAKIILLAGFVVAGYFAMKPRYGVRTRLFGTTLALVQLALIFWLALAKPVF